MASRRWGLVTGGLLAGALLLGTAGLVTAQDPTTVPTPSPATVGPSWMMGGQMGAGMMGGQMGGRMGTLTADQLKQMDALHDQMIESGACDPARMQAFHSELYAGR